MTQSVILKAIENKLKTIDDKKAIFEGELKPEWVVWNTPNGGYLVGIMLKCGQEYMVKQINKEQDNLLSCTVTYISVLSSKAPYTVEVKLIKKGKATSILEIEISQKVRIVLSQKWLLLV